MGEVAEKKVAKKQESGDAGADVPKVERKAGTKSVIFKATTGDVLKALQKISSGAGRSKAMAILGHVLMVKDGQSLRFTATDLERQMDVETELGGSPGRAMVTADLKKLLDILRALPADAITTLTSDGVKSQLVSGKSKFTLQSMDASDFPLVKEAEHDGVVTLKQGMLRSTMEQVAYAMAVADIRHYLNGMLLETDGKAVYAVATDGSRLAMAECLTETESAKRSIILPGKSVGEMLKLLSDGDEEVELRLSVNQASMTMGGVRMVTKLIEGKFPDYRRVVPSKVTNTVTFERAEIQQALQRAALMTGEKFKAVRLKFSENELSLSVEFNGESVSEVIGIDFEAESVELGVNVMYLLDAVGNIEGDTVTLGLRTGQDSVLVTQEKNPNFRGVVMPMRL